MSKRSKNRCPYTGHKIERGHNVKACREIEQARQGSAERRRNQDTRKVKT